MSLIDKITVLILTLNEGENIARTLFGVRWAKRIVVVDSGSCDGTIEIVRSYPQAELVTRPFDTHQAQWNFGLDVCGESSKWILALDADYVLDDVFLDELNALNPDNNVGGYNASFRYFVYGRALRATLYPEVTVLYRHEGARYVQRGHTQRLIIRGIIEDLKSRIYHDDRKPLSRWFAAQCSYAKLEADYLLGTDPADLRRTDRIRLMGWPAPLLVFFYTLVIKRCVLDGWPGWFYVLQRTLSELMISLELAYKRIRPSQSASAKVGAE